MSDEPSPVLGSAEGSVEAPVEPSPASAEPGSPTTVSVIDRDTLLQAIPEEIRGEAIFQNINAENPVADLAGQFLNAQKLVGVEKMPAPKEDWTPDDWGKFWERAGRPESLDGYTMPDTDLSFDADALNTFRELAHNEGLTSKQFSAIMEHYTQISQEALTGQGAAQEEMIKQGLQSLQQEWGENYDANLQQADKFLRQYDDPALLELIQSDRVLQNNPAVIKLFHRLGLDQSEAAVRVGDSTSPALINSSEQAQAALKKYEADNWDILFKAKENPSLEERSRMDAVRERRAELFKLAYPQE